MPKRSYDFEPSQILEIKAFYGYICAACGDSNPRNMTADHHAPGSKKDDGVCLCSYCNTTIKGSKVLGEAYRLIPRKAVPVDADLFLKLHANQDAYASHCEAVVNYNYQVQINKCRTTAGGKPLYNVKKPPFFVAPF